MSRRTGRAALARIALPMVSLPMVSLVVVSLVGTSLVAASSASAASSGAASSKTVWLCRPGLAHNPCTSNLATTVVSPNGATSIHKAKPAKHAPIDCFYVYPTVSAQPTVNADLKIDPEETAIAIAQASRFSQVCRVYAPMYPQLTLSAIGTSGGISAQAAAKAYAGVLAGWKDYLAHYNHGRGVVFIGHSQGSGMLIQLLRAQVDPEPKVRHRLVSAVLLGGNVTVPVGRGVGGDFKHIPACRSKAQTGCVVAYSSFEQAPPSNSLFGRVGRGVSALSGQGADTKLQVLCVNPAKLAGGTNALEPYLPTSAFPGPIGQVDRPVPSASTPWVNYPDLYTGECKYVDGASWLQINDIGTSSDQRLRVSQTLGPTWGLHLGDVNLALGNLVGLVRHQAAAYTH